MDFKEVDKMTKKERREYYARFRNTWGISPITRREHDKRAKRHKRDAERAKDAFKE